MNEMKWLEQKRKNKFSNTSIDQGEFFYDPAQF